MTTVKLNGVTLSVTPVDEMPSHRQLTAAFLNSRLQAAMEREDWPAVHDSMVDLVQYVIDEPIRRETLDGLTGQEIEVLLTAVFQPDGGDGDD